MREISKNPTIAAVAGASVSAIVAIVIALMQPDPQVPLKSGESLSILQTIEKVEFLSRGIEREAAEVVRLQEEITSLAAENSRLTGERQSMANELIRCGGKLPIPSTQKVTLSNGIIITLGTVEKSGSTAVVEFEVHNPGKETGMQLSSADVFYQDGSFEVQGRDGGNLGSVSMNSTLRIPSEHSIKGQIRFHVPASLSKIDIVTLHFMNGVERGHRGREERAEFRNFSL